MEDINILVELKIVDFKNYKEEKLRLINTCNEMIKLYQEKILEYKDNIHDEEEKVKEQLFNLIPESDFKETATQWSYKAPSGQFIHKKETENIKLKTDIDMDLINDEYIKIKKSIDWINLKKRLIIDDEKVINKETGEIIDYCEIEKKESEFKIKL